MPSAVAAGEIDDRPVAAPQQPVRAEAREQVVDVAAQRMRRPVAPGFRREPRELARDLRMLARAPAMSLAHGSQSPVAIAGLPP